MPATFRRATPEDAEALARLVIDGFETYRAFTPPSWEPRAIETELARRAEPFDEPRLGMALVEYRHALA